MEKETDEVNFKGFFGRLFCKHKTIRMGDLTVYGAYDKTHPSNKYWRFICKKCGRIEKYKQF